MPAPQKVSTDQLIAAIRALAEREGVDAVTMSSIAAAVGIQAPSLYKRAANRHELLALAADDVAYELTTALRDLAARLDDPADVLAESARALRKLAARSPQCVTLLFGPQDPAAAPSPSSVAPAIDVLLTSLRALGHADPLPAARTLTAWAYGFCLMENSNGFRQGGNLDVAFEHGLAAVLRGLELHAKHTPLADSGLSA